VRNTKKIWSQKTGNPIDIKNLNLTNACPVLSVQEVIQRAVILKLTEEKMSGDLKEGILANILPSRKNPFFVYKRKKGRKIRVKKSEIRSRNKVRLLLREIPKHLNGVMWK